MQKSDITVSSYSLSLLVRHGKLRFVPHTRVERHTTDLFLMEMKSTLVATVSFPK